MGMDAVELRQVNVDWIDRLKKILQQGRISSRPERNRPDTKHRSTEEAVKLLLSNLREGTSKKRDNATTGKDIDKAVFNSVDLLMTDKMNKSEKKSKLQALEMFENVLNQEFAAQSKKEGALDVIWKKKIEEALLALRAEVMEDRYLNNGALMKDIVFEVGGSEALENIYLRKTTTPEVREQIRREMLREKAGCQALARKPRFGGAVLSSINPNDLYTYDLADMFGKDKVDDVLAEALLSIASKQPREQGQDLDRNTQCDPELFKRLAQQVKPERFNDDRGLGPRVYQWLWRGGDYVQICDLIERGADTTLAARASGEQGVRKDGIHAGFVQPLQHIIAPYLREIGTAEATGLQPVGPAAGAKQIFETLGDKAVTLTKWSDVTDSQMIREFTGNPGTIWGFESIREPFVDAAKETDEGKRPLRMLDLWDAIQPTLTAARYNDLIENPIEEAESLVASAVNVIRGQQNHPKYSHIADDLDGYIEKFEPHAKELLIEFATQMPKGTYIREGLDDRGGPRKYYEPNPGEGSIKDAPARVGVSEVAGIDPSSITSGLACKAGLWWAKKVGEPVYYCLDGLNMHDVVDYKLLKNRAINEFIANGGQQELATPHREVITMMEVREILKNWDELKDDDGDDIVIFVRKGRKMKREEANEFVTNWHEKMKVSNEQAGRTPAPPRAQFINELNDIDPGLFERLPDGKEGDMDARDIVKKSGYLLKVANSQPKIVLKYLISRCKVLIDYGLISDELRSAAQRFGEVSLLDFSEENSRNIEEAEEELHRQIMACHQKFQAPLNAALIRNF